jgi:hypothetical protein
MESWGKIVKAMGWEKVVEPSRQLSPRELEPVEILARL